MSRKVSRATSCLLAHTRTYITNRSCGSPRAASSTSTTSCRTCATASTRSCASALTPSSTATLWKTGRGADAGENLVGVPVFFYLPARLSIKSLRRQEARSGGRESRESRVPCCVRSVETEPTRTQHLQLMFYTPYTIFISPLPLIFHLERAGIGAVVFTLFTSNDLFNKLTFTSRQRHTLTQPATQTTPPREPPARPPPPHNGRPTSAITLTMLAGPAVASTLGCHLSRPL